MPRTSKSHMPDVLILGSGGHARVVLDAIRAAGVVNPVGFLDDRRQADSSVDGLPVLGPISGFGEISAQWNVGRAVVAIGDNFVRRSVVERIDALKSGVDWICVLHPAAAVSPNASIGPGTVVFAGSIINTGSAIGAHCIVNTRGSIDHDNRTGDFTSFGPGVVTGGNVKIGRGSHIGIGSVLKHGVSVGSDAVVGAGSIVLTDIADLCIAYGAPARIVRARKPSDPYL